MSKKLSIEEQVILDRLNTKSSTWDSAISETETAIKSLERSLKYFREQKNAGAPFPVGSINTIARLITKTGLTPN